MLISHSHKFIFFHVAKTGGMSVRGALEEYCEEPTKFRIKRPPREINGSPNPIYEMWEAFLLHAKARDTKSQFGAALYDSYYKFAFVRNPWDWQVSMYHFILKQETHVKHELVKSFGRFEPYLEWVIATKNPYPKGATKLQKDVLTDRQGNLMVDFVGRYELLAQDFAQICERVSLTVQLPHVNKSKHRDYKSYYNDHTRKLVADHFAEDISLFGYTFEGVLTK